MNSRVIYLVVVLFLFSGFVLSQETIDIKFATVAPEGSAWLNVMREFNDAVQKATNNEVRFRIYPGMVQGDEKDVLRKIRINQLHSGGFTGVGLGEILSEVRILDSPFLFRDYQEVDYVSNKFYDRFAKMFEQKGYILLGWAEVGFVYIYTNQPVQNVQDLKGVKMWMWEGDPLAEATFKAFGISPIPLSLTDVLTSLQTGLIDGVYTSPLACLSLQWFTKTKFMIDVPLTNSNGAALISTRMFNKLSPAQQKIVLEKGKEYFSKLTKISREDNLKSVQEMVKTGMQLIEIKDPVVLKQFEQTGETARQNLVGRLYDQALLDEIESAVKDYRSKK